MTNAAVRDELECLQEKNVMKIELYFFIRALFDITIQGSLCVVSLFAFN